MLHSHCCKSIADEFSESSTWVFALQGMEQLAEEVAKELLSLFSGVALAALEEGRKSNSDPSPATILASIIAPPRSASPVHTTAVQMAATAVVTEEMFAKLPAASQATLAVVRLFLESRFPHIHG